VDWGIGGNTRADEVAIKSKEGIVGGRGDFVANARATFGRAWIDVGMDEL
jgi:acyl-CoA hydrolase